MEDEEILKRIKNGDVNAYSDIVSKYHLHILNFIYAAIGDKKLVEDIGQEVFISAYQSIPDFDLSRGTPFSAWLFTIARNRCSSAYRAKKRHMLIPIHEVHEIPDTLPQTDEPLMLKERIQLIMKAVEQIPEPFKSTLLQSMTGGTLEDIARSGNVAIGTAKSRLSRARDRLKAALGITCNSIKENWL